MSEDLDTQVRRIAEKRESALVSIILGNLETMKFMDFQDFIAGLREQDYDLGILDLEQMELITNAFEDYWKGELGIEYKLTRLTKVLNLPSIVVYEAISKEFGNDKVHLDKLWEGFLAISNGTRSPYGHSSEDILDALRDVPKDALYIFGSMPRVYHGRRIETREEMHRVEHEERVRILGEFVSNVGDRERAIELATTFSEHHRDFYENRLMREMRELGKGGSVIGDYYNGASVRTLCIVIGRYLKPLGEVE